MTQTNNTTPLAPNADAVAFVTAGNATVTLVSLRTGARFTYKVEAPRKRTERGGLTRDFDANVRFVSLMNGPCNESSFGYVGFCKRDAAGNWTFVHGRAKAKAGADAPSVKGFAWFLRNPGSDLVEIHHSGRCGKCGRKLTVPESIETGFGPECAARLNNRAA